MPSVPNSSRIREGEIGENRAEPKLTGFVEIVVITRSTAASVAGENSRKKNVQAFRSIVDKNRRSPQRGELACSTPRSLEAQRQRSNQFKLFGL